MTRSGRPANPSEPVAKRRECGQFDPPKASAGAAIAALGTKGVGVKIISGDNERVTQHVCAELGIPITGVLTGAELEALSD
jgi:Mg2+-importing ATPase